LKGIKKMKTKMKLAPIHPGKVLREDFLIPLGITAYRVARDLGVEPIAITSICNGKRSVSAIMALKLGRYFKTSPEIWTGLQAQYDLEMASRKLSAKIERIHPCAALATQTR
jgi:addiction module HigA family antidote